MLGKDKGDFVSASERVNGARATNIEQLGTAWRRCEEAVGSRRWDSKKKRKKEKPSERGRKWINKEEHNVVRDMINVADRERNRTSRSGTKAAFGLTLQGSVAPLPHGRRRRDSSIGRHPVSFSILLERSVSWAYHDTHLAALISYFNEDASVMRHKSQTDWSFILE